MSHVLKQRRCRVCIATALAFMLLSPCAKLHAQSLSSGVHAGAGFSDNITRAGAGQEVSGEWLDAGLSGQFAKQLGILEADLNSDLSYRRYSTHALGNELFGGANGHASVRIFDNAVKWVADEIYGQSAVSSFQANSPANRQGTNFLSTGPDVYIPLGERTRLLLSARYALVHYQTLPLDSKRKTGQAGL